MDTTTWLPEQDTLWIFTLPNYRDDSTTVETLWESFKKIFPEELRISAVRGEMRAFPVALLGDGGLQHLVEGFFAEGYTNSRTIKDYLEFARDIETTVSKTLEDRSFPDFSCVFLVGEPSFSLIKPLETLMSKIKGYSQVDYLQHFSSGKEKVTVFVMD